MEVPSAMPDYYVIVCGAGPAGCVLARDLARAGISVTLLEKLPREQLGHPGSIAVEIATLKQIGLPLPHGSAVNLGPMVKGNGEDVELYEQLAIRRVEVWAPDYSTKVDIDFNYILADHRVLNQILLDQAVSAGVEVKFEHEVKDLSVIGLGSLDRVQVMGVMVQDFSAEGTFYMPANLVVDATGSSAALRTKLPESSGIGGKFKDEDFNKVFRTVRRRDLSKITEDPIANHHRYVFSGYSWVHIYDAATIDVGVMVKKNSQIPDPERFVTDYVAEHPSISSEVLYEGSDTCLIARSPSSLVANGFLVVGDAAGQVNPTTGYGVSGALEGSMLAAQTVISAAEAGKSDVDALWSYNYNWFVKSKRGANFAGLVILRQLLRALPDDDLIFLFQNDILTTELLGSSINGIFDVPTWQDKLVSAMKGFLRASLLVKLNQGVALGQKIYNHYLLYPPTWDLDAYQAWCAKVEKLFQKIGK